MWQRLSDAHSLYISARPRGGSWGTLGTIPLDMSGESASGRYRYGDIALGVPVDTYEPPTPVPTATPTPTPSPTPTPTGGEHGVELTAYSDGGTHSAVDADGGIGIDLIRWGPETVDGERVYVYSVLWSGSAAAPAVLSVAKRCGVDCWANPVRWGLRDAGDGLFVTAALGTSDVWIPNQTYRVQVEFEGGALAWPGTTYGSCSGARRAGYSNLTRAEAETLGLPLARSDNDDNGIFCER